MSKQGLIYEIVCNITGERYVGSTFEPTVARRMAGHRIKKNKCASNQIINRNNYYYGLLETVSINYKHELRMCERKWFDQLECINKNKPFSSDVEKVEQKKVSNDMYRETHQNDIKAYYQANKEKILHKSICGCGGHFMHCNKSKHITTKKHCRWLIETKMIENVLALGVSELDIKQ